MKVLKDNLKIGVFDSGIGGLTVLKKLLQGFPRGVDFFYFADTARVPYGSKPIETLRGYIGEIFDFFFQLGIDAIVTACNTSDSVLSQREKQNLPVPYFSIIDPTVRTLGSIAPKGSEVSVIATSNTVRRSLYLRKLFRYENLRRITQKACPLFVPIIEEGIWEGEIVDAVVSYYLAEINRMEPDYLILGCTHYPFIRKVIESSISRKTLLIDPADFILVDLISWIGEIDGEESRVTYYVSGNPESFQRVLKRYFQREGDVVPVDLVNERITVKR